MRIYPDMKYVGLHYGAFTVLISFLFYAPVLIAEGDYLAFPYVLFMIGGGTAPFWVALVFLRMQRKSVIGFLKSCVAFHRIQKTHFGIMVLFLFTIVLLPLITTNLLSEGWQWIAPSVSIFLPVGLIFGGLEEPGWRGYMQKISEQEFRPIIVCLFIGFFWALWHWPLFFIEDTYQHGLGAFSADFWRFNLMIIITTPIYAFLFHITRHSIPVLILFHGLGNALREVLHTPDAFHVLIAEGALVLIVLVVGRRYFFGRKSGLSDPL